jgi:deoxycytidylate deaminase
MVKAKRPAKSGSHEPRPELIIAVAGAIGIDTDKLHTALQKILQEVGYSSEVVRIIDTLQALPEFKGKLPLKPEDKRIRTRMDAGNKFRQMMGAWDALAVYAIGVIRSKRQDVTGDPDTPAGDRAFIIRSVKNPDEVKTFRRIYGPAFILISASAPRRERLKRLTNAIAESNNDLSHPSKYGAAANNLIEDDTREDDVPYGQNLRDTFPLADVFVEVSEDRKKLEESLRKFFQLLFRHPYHTPTVDEYGMFMAYTGGLRSSDLGRQVGASLVANDGEIIGVGANEVPRPGGGQYWYGDIPDARDFTSATIAFDIFRSDILIDILTRIKAMGWLSNAKKRIDVTVLAEQAKIGMDNALYLDVIEYGRTVHAEMSAILGAARGGIAVKNATLYSTTFPCHECARSVVAAGISRVVYIHPYPKSRVESLFSDSISVDGDGEEHSDERTIPPRIRFVPFVGIAPNRYQTLFDARDIDRKKNGKLIEWDGRKEQPRGFDIMRTYSRKLKEEPVLARLIEEMKNKGLYKEMRYSSRRRAS